VSDAAVFALFSVPLLTFVSAGVLEFKRDRRGLLSFSRALPLALAVAVSILLMIDVYQPYLSFRLRLSNTMSVLSLLVAVAAIICRYKSRLTIAFMFTGGLVLALFWRLNRWLP